MLVLRRCCCWTDFLGQVFFVAVIHLHMIILALFNAWDGVGNRLDLELRYGVMLKL